MATFEKRGDTHQARIRIPGHPAVSKSFKTLKEAKTWAEDTEDAMRTSTYKDPKIIANLTIGELIKRYNKEMRPAKGFGKNKTAVLASLQREFEDLLIGNLTLARLTEYVLKRKNQPKPAGGVTIGIDLTYLRGVLLVARTLWELPISLDMFTDVRAKMKLMKMRMKSKERDRRTQPGEIIRLKEHFAAKKRQKIPMGDIIDFAEATAMRSSEITRIEWCDVNELHHTVIIRDRKDPQEKEGNDQVVPVLADAWAILQRQPRTSDQIFPFNEATISTIFPRACKVLGIIDLHFHDLRHEGTSRLFEDGYAIQEVAVFTGHKDWKQLKRYTNLKAVNLHNDKNGNPRRNEKSSFEAAIWEIAA